MLPTFVVIGAMKAGTSSMYNYLRAHPQVFMSSTKELDFFIEGDRWTFDGGRMLVVTTEKLGHDRASVMSEVYGFIGVDPEIVPAAIGSVANRGDERRGQRTAVRRLRGSAAFRAARRALPAPVRGVGFRAVTSEPARHAPALPATTRERIIDELRPDLVALRDLLDERFDAWGLLDG